MDKIAISGFQAAMAPASGLAVARSLEEVDHNFEVVGVDYTKYATGLLSAPNICDTYVMPWTNNSRKLALQWIRLCRKANVNLIVPCLDEEIVLLSNSENLLLEEGIRMLAPRHESLMAVRKDKIGEFLGDNGTGFFYPDTKTLYSEAEMINELATRSYPVVLKGKLRESRYCFNENECISAFHELLNFQGAPVLLQHVVNGEQLCIVGAFANCGQPIGQLTLKKMGINSNGNSWCYVTLKNADLEAKVLHLMELLDWRGAFEIDLAVTSDGLCYILDVNARFPDYIDGLIGALDNLPYRLVDNWLTGRKECESTTLSELSESTVLVRGFKDCLISSDKIFNADLLHADRRRNECKTDDRDLYWGLP